jgi:hypothetical protein
MKVYLIALAFLITNNLLFSQQNRNFKYDVGISYGLNPANLKLGQYGLYFRNELNDKWHLKYALTHNKTISDDRQTKVLIYENGAEKILRTQGEFQVHFASRFGTDYSPINYLRLGAEAILGYAKGNSYIVDENEDPNYDYGIDHIFEYNNTSVPNIDQSSVQQRSQYVQFVDANHYLSTGVSIQIGTYFSFLKRWEIGVNYSPELVRYNLLNTESKSIVVGPYDTGFTSFNVVNHFVNFDLKFKL